MLSSISRQGIFFIPLILILPKALGLNGIILAQPIADIITTIFTVFLAFGLQKQINSYARGVESEAV